MKIIFIKKSRLIISTYWQLTLLDDIFYSLSFQFSLSRKRLYSKSYIFYISQTKLPEQITMKCKLTDHLILSPQTAARLHTVIAPLNFELRICEEFEFGFIISCKNGGNQNFTCNFRLVSNTKNFDSTGKNNLSNELANKIFDL